MSLKLDYEVDSLTNKNKLETFVKVKINSGSPCIFVSSNWNNPIVFISTIYVSPSENDYLLVAATEKFWKLIV